MRNKHVLITGGAGFIGSHLTDRYLEQGCKVTILDNFITGSEKNITHHKHNPNLKFYKHDVSQPWPEMEIADLVMHFACPASPVDFTKIPIEIMKVDTYGTFLALDKAKEDGARFVVASTSEIYGDPLVHPQTEDYWGNVNTLGLRACYDEAKRFSETCTMVYHRKFGVNTGIVRIFNTYGPRMRLDDGRVVPNFCGQALKHEPITVYGNGTQTRSFCFVDDLVEGIMRLAATNEHMPVNLGNPDEYTIMDFAKVVLESIPESKSRIKFCPLLHEDDPKQRRPEISRAKNLLDGWEPKIPLRTGIKTTIDYFKTNICV